MQEIWNRLCTWESMYPEIKRNKIWNGISMYVCRQFCMKLALYLRYLILNCHSSNINHCIILCKGIMIVQMLMPLYIDSITPVYH